MNCKWSNRLYCWLPIAAVRQYVISSHMASCPLCAKGNIADSDLRRLGVSAAQLAQQPSLWPELVWRLPAGKMPAIAQVSQWRTRFWRRFAAGSAVAIVLLAAIVYVIAPQHAVQSDISPAEQASAAPVFSLHSAKLNGLPASTVIFKARSAPVVAVWFAAGVPVNIDTQSEAKKNG